MHSTNNDATRVLVTFKSCRRPLLDKTKLIIMDIVQITINREKSRAV